MENTTEKHTGCTTSIPMERQIYLEIQRHWGSLCEQIATTDQTDLLPTSDPAQHNLTDDAEHNNDGKGNCEYHVHNCII